VRRASSRTSLRIRSGLPNEWQKRHSLHRAHRENLRALLHEARKEERSWFVVYVLPDDADARALRNREIVQLQQTGVAEVCVDLPRNSFAQLRARRAETLWNFL